MHNNVSFRSTARIIWRLCLLNQLVYADQLSTGQNKLFSKRWGSMSDLFVDAGNTNVKWRLGQTGENSQCASESSEFFDWIESNSAIIDTLVVSSVRAEQWNLDLIRLCEGLRKNYWFAISVAESEGLHSAYNQADQLGIDRWLAMLALWNVRREGFLLVDAGTAVTMDVVDDGGQHIGGYILPGVDLQRSALLDRSENLKRLISSEPSHSIALGRDTSEAIHHGILASIGALISRLAAENGLKSESIVIAGGDAGKLRETFELGSLEKNLVLKGLILLWTNKQQLQQSRDK